MTAPEPMPSPSQYSPGAWGLIGTWTKWCWVFTLNKYLYFSTIYSQAGSFPTSFPLSLWKPHSSAQPYLMNFSMTSSTHICSLRKLMP